MNLNGEKDECRDRTSEGDLRHTERESKKRERWRKGCRPGSSDDLFSFLVSSRDFVLAFFSLDFRLCCKLHTELTDIERLMHTLTPTNWNRRKPKIKSSHHE